MRIIKLINYFGNLFLLAAYWSRAIRRLLTHTSNKLKEETVAAFQFGKGYKSIYAILLRSIIHKWEKFKAISNLAGSGHPIIFTCSLQGQYKQCLDKKKTPQRRSNTPELQARLPDLNDNININIDDGGTAIVALQKNTKEPPRFANMLLNESQDSDRELLKREE